MAVADFHHEPAVRFEGGPCLGDEAPVDIESGWAGVERGGGLEVAHLRLEDFGFGDVGWVGDDGIKGFTGDCGEQVGREKTDAAGDVVTLSVLTCDGECGCGVVEGGDGREGKMMGEGDGDGSGAGSDVGDAERSVVRDALQKCFDEVLCFRAGNEDGGRDAESEAEKFLLASDVLDGLVLRAACEPLFVGGLLRGREFGVGVGEEKSAVSTGGVKQQQLGVAARGGEMREGSGSLGEGGGEGE